MSYRTKGSSHEVQFETETEQVLQRGSHVSHTSYSKGILFRVSFVMTISSGSVQVEAQVFKVVRTLGLVHEVQVVVEREQVEQDESQATQVEPDWIVT